MAHQENLKIQELFTLGEACLYEYYQISIYNTNLHEELK